MAHLDFKGKEFVRSHHLSVPSRRLEVDAKKSVGKPGLDGNLIIHGDNLHALKALVPMYSGKVGCIYIDPPYNTGNEGWRYNDNVNSPMMQCWLKESAVGIDDGLRHDKWCAMMWPRLMLLQELLADDGIIFVSIDDNEHHRLRMMMDEIFGAEMYRNTIVVSRVKKNIRERETTPAMNSGQNYVLLYAKSEAGEIVPPTTFQDKKPRWHAFDAPGVRATMEYELLGQVPPKGRHWMYAEERAQELLKDGKLRLSNSGTVQYFLDASTEKLLDSNWTDIQEGASKFDFPNGEKNVALLERLIGMSAKPDAVILDSFAGSGTTAHAVLAMNKRDGGQRKFVLVECEDYADELTGKRVRRVIRGIPEMSDKALKDGLGGEFTYCTLGKEIELESLLAGGNLPDYESLGSLLFHTATREVFAPAGMDAKAWYLGASSKYHVWLIYRPDTDFLQSPDAALTLDRARKMVKDKGREKRHLVFAPVSLVSQASLRVSDGDSALPIDFQPLPWLLYKVGGGEGG